MPKRAISIMVAACAVILLGVPASALAHWGSPVSFGAGQLRAPIGVSVNSAGDVFVANLLGEESKMGVSEFDLAHNVLIPPSPFGAGSGYDSGVAVDPVTGDVYVMDAHEQAIHLYDPSDGELVSAIPVPGSDNFPGLGTVVQIASDAAGNVYVPNGPHNEVQVFASDGGAPSGGVAATITGSGAEALSEPVGVAVAPSGDIWVADAGNNRIEEFDPTGGFLKQVAIPGVLAVAADTAGDVFASVEDSTGAHILEFDSSGVQVDDFGLGTIGPSRGIAIDEANQVFYAVDFQNNVVWAFVIAPEVSTTSATGVLQSAARLNGHVDPVGGGNVTACEFEYGTSTSYGQTVPCSPAPPYTAAEDVHAELANLSSGTEYHYRLRAANAKGSSHGEDQTLITSGAGIDSETSEVRNRDAKLSAEINPRGADTTCEVQYVTQGAFESSGYTNATSVPCAPVDLGSGSVDQHAEVLLAGLPGDSVYHYRFLAIGGGLTADGADQMFATFGISAFAFAATEQDGQPDTQAGGHPYELTTTFHLNTTTLPGQYGHLTPYPFSAEVNPKDVRVELPPGLIGNPEATPKCPPYDVAHADCSGATQVGILTIDTQPKNVGETAQETSSPIYNLVPPAGMAAQFGARFNGFVTAHINAHVRTGGDYGVTADSLYISAAEGVIGATVTFWGVPADPSHDPERYCPRAGDINESPPEPEEGFYCTSGEPLTPFLTNPTSCSGSLTARLAVDSWQEPGVFVGSSTEMPAVTGCDKPNFTPTIALTPESSATSSPTGLKVDLHVPQNENPTGLAEANLKNAVVTLPEGMAVNPSSANGLGACSPGQIELHGPEPAGCPDSSKIGSVEIDTPLLDRPLKGGVYLASPFDNPFGSLLGIYIAVYDPVSGVVVKVAGHVEADPATGRLRTRFDENPQLPFEDLKVDFFGGPDASLKTPDTCGSFVAGTDLTPWTSPEGADATPSSEFAVDEGCGVQGFAPVFSAETTDPQAGGFSPFVMTLSRGDRDQAFSTVALKMPPGVLGVLRSVPLCGEPQAAQGTCPAASQIGHVVVAAGVGSDPVVLPQPGRQEDPVFLTGGYDGAPFGLSVVEHAEAGPFNLGPDGGKPIVVRAAITVDPKTAQISVQSDQLPHILQGIPLQVRTINVVIDRAGFTFNPTSCATMSLTGTATSVQGSTTDLSNRFQAAGCAGLPFKPLFTAATAGNASKANGASFDVRVLSKGGPQAGSREANIRSVKVDLPKQLPSRLTTLQKACTAAQFEANPAGCPKESNVGTAIASTPVLAHSLTGPAYLVSHGGEAFPDLEIVLQGEGVTLVLDGNTQIKKGITSSTFRSVPDAPISSFELKLPSGKYSILSANVPASKHYSLCGQSLTMPTQITGQNGAVVKQSTKIAITGCPKAKKTKKAKKGGRRKG